MISLKWYEPAIQYFDWKAYCGFFITGKDEEHKQQIHEQCIAIVWGWA